MPANADETAHNTDTSLPGASEPWLRRGLWLYVAALVLCGAGYARYSSYLLDGDAVSFMDIADAMRAHQWSLVANGYWNPAYSAALALGETIGHSTRWTELATFFWVNFWIFLGCIAACIFFAQSLARLRDRCIVTPESPAALWSTHLQVVSLALMFFSFQRELTLGAVRSDSLLLFFFLLAAGILLRILAGGAWALYPLLGAALGCAYLTKSFAFVPTGFLFLALLIWGVRRKERLGPMTRGRIVAGTMAACIVFAAIAAPYVIAISRQRGRPTTGESARMNYAFFVDQTARWHEFHTGNLGHATADFRHPEQLLLDSPPVYSYARHPLGTYPLWFDPAYWTDEIHPHFWLPGQIARMERCAALLLRFLIGHLEPFCLVAALLFAGCFFPRRRAMWWPLGAAAAWGLLMLAIYFPVDLQDRYLTGAFLFVMVTLLAVLRATTAIARRGVTALVMLLAFLSVADAASDLGARRRLLSVTTHAGGWYSPQIYQAAQGLNDLGIGNGETVACFGDIACYLDQYWARLAETPIRAEVDAPDGSDPGRFWAGLADQAQVIAALRTQGVHAIVASFAPEARVPDGWQQLGESNFYAYLIPPQP